MPSLEQLELFKTSFKDVGNEALIMSNNPMLIEDFELPDDDPPAPFPEELSEGPVFDEFDEKPSLNISDLGLDLPADSFSGTGDSGFDFSDLVGDNSLQSISQTEETEPISSSGIPDVSGFPDVPDAPDVPDVPDVSGFDDGEAIPAETEFPNDLLSGFSDDLESGGLPLDEEIPSSTDNLTEDAPADSGDGFSDLEFPDIDLTHAVDMGGESTMASLEETPGEEEIPSVSDLPAEKTDGIDTQPSPSDSEESQGEGSLLDMEMPAAGDSETDLPGGEDFGADSFGTGDFGTDDISTGGLDTAGMDLGSSDFGAADSIDFGEGDLSVGSGDESQDISPETESADEGFAELPAFEETPEESHDSFDTFTAGDDWKVPDTITETPDFTAAPADDFGDFSLSGFDETGTEKKPGKARQTEFMPDTSGDVEEIRLSEAEYRQLQDTLSEYPLNLRIACEELIAEQAVPPEQMSALIKLLVRGAPAKETASLAGKILGKTITIPKGYAKQTGAELEAEQASFGYIFTRRFLPILRIAGVIALVTASLGYLIWRFAVIPMQATSRYKEGYNLILNGEYTQANERFRQAFEINRVKKWFYRYAEAFRDQRQYIYARRKYDELLRIYPRDKKGALDYAAMESNYIKNYENADRIIRTYILDYAVNDREGLLALAENSLAWGEEDYNRYEDARAAFSRLLEKYGRQDLYLEGMLKYFIRTDKLNEVLHLQSHFMSNPKKRKISVPTLAELGGYLLDKRFEETDGVPDEYADEIEGIRDILIRAINTDGSYPESYYHMARYYFRYGSVSEERQSLKDAIRAFTAAPEESPRRISYRIDTQRRYAEILINAREFFPAEGELVRGVRLYEDARARGVIKNTRPEYGRLYADLGDLEFFVKSGNMDAALRFYEEAERNDYSPPEIQYRMGAAHYQNKQWEDALMRFFALTSVMPNNKRLLYALGNTSYLRGNYFAAQSYYNRLMDLLDTEKVRFPNISPGGQPEEQDLAERIMVADNNLGVTLETLTQISGDTSYRTRALYLFSESIRAWDVLTRNPENMARMQPIKDLYSPGINLAFLNTQNILRPSPAYEQQIFLRIDRDCLEPSDWETLAPRDYRLSDQLPITLE